MRTFVTAVSAVTLVVAAVSGCSISVGSGPPTVAKTDLQNDIADRLTKAGETPESVTCNDDIVGVVDKTTQCEVVLSETNSIEPVVRVTKVDGKTVSYEMTPALSKAQLEKAVKGLLTKASGQQVDSVSCESGLQGEEGAVAHCDVEAGGSTMRRTVEVTKVEGLLMNFDVVPVLAKAEVESSLLDELEQQVGQRPDRATCSKDLEGTPRNTVDCTIFAGPETQDFLLTVTSVTGDKINYKYEPTG